MYFYHSDLPIAIGMGSSSWITDASGDVNQHLQYLPLRQAQGSAFGEDYIYQRNSSWAVPYTFSGKEKDSETGYSYFGARYYDSDLSIWLSVDPLASKYPSMSAYMYVAGNPVMLVDLDGMRIDDYFTKDGEFLGSDNAESDAVRVIDQSDWDANKTTNNDGVETIDHDTGVENSKLHSESGITDEASLNIYQHYNPTDLKLVDSGKDIGGASFRFTTIKTTTGNKTNTTYSTSLSINLKGNKRLKISDHYNEIVNIFIHENQHYTDFITIGAKSFLEFSRERLESRAVYAQMEHSSFDKTRLGFQKSAKLYGEKFGIIFKVKSLPAKQIPLNVTPQNIVINHE